MSVSIEIPIGELAEEEELPSRTYALDLDAGRIGGIIDGIEAVCQSIRKALATVRFDNLIYDDQYGSEFRTLISDGEASRDLIEESIPGMVRDALLPDTRILDVYDFETSFSEDEARVSFKAETIFGTAEMTEVKM